MISCDNSSPSIYALGQSTRLPLQCRFCNQRYKYQGKYFSSFFTEHMILFLMIFFIKMNILACLVNHMKEKHGSAILNLERNHHLNKKLEEINERLEAQRRLLQTSSPPGQQRSTTASPTSSGSKSPVMSPNRSPTRSSSSSKTSRSKMSPTPHHIGHQVHHQFKRQQFKSHHLKPIHISVIQKNPFFKTTAEMA